VDLRGRSASMIAWPMALMRSLVPATAVTVPSGLGERLSNPARALILRERVSWLRLLG